MAEDPDKKLFDKLAGLGVSAPERYRAELELAKRAAERAGKPTYRWTVLAAIAAVVAAFAGILSLFK